MNTSNKNFPNPGLLAPWYDEAFECSFIRSCYMGTSDVPGELAPIMSMWRHDTPVFIQADTGTGKSTFVIRELYRHVVEHGGRLLVVSNRVALTVQYKAEMLRLYAPKQLKAFTAYGLQHQDHFEGLSAEFCSYQGLRAFSRKYKEGKIAPFDYVVFDEVHFLCSDSFFAEDTDWLRLNIPSVFQRAVRIYMTATPWAIQNLLAEAEECTVPLSDRILWSSGHFSRPPFGGQLGDNMLLPGRYMLAYRFPYIRRNYRIHALPAESRAPFDSLLPELIAATPKDEKWLIFVESKAQGMELVKRLGEGCNYLDADHKGDSLWDEVTMNAKFPGRILVTTAVVDNGVNLKDNQLVHIVLQSTDHVQFIQELGRKRMGTSEVVHLYIPDLTARQLSLLETRNNGLLKHLSDFKEDSPQYLYYKRMDLWNNGTPELRHLFVLDNNGSLTVNRCAEQVLLQRKLFYQELKTAFRVGDRHPFIRHVVCSWLGFSEEALDDCRWHGSVMQDELDLFLKSWIGKPIVGKGEQNNFSEKYRRLRTAAYGSRKKGNNGADRIWGARIIKGDLADLKLPYDLDIGGSIWVIQKVERQDSAGDD